MSDKNRFMEWVRAHQDALYRHAYWLVGDPDVAADLVQEAFYRAWKGRRGLRRPDRPFPWLLTILRRAAFQELSHGARYVRPAFEHALTDERVDNPTSSDELIDLGRALAGLEPAQRDLLLLYALHGLSYAEIAAQLDVPVGTVMSRLSRARAALHRLRAAGEAENVVPINRGRAGS